MVDDQYYSKRMPRLLKNFDRLVRLVYPVLERYFPPEELPKLMESARQEYARLIPEIPYIGGKQPFTTFLLFTAQELALYRVATEYGKSVEETGEIGFEIGRAYLKRMPTYLKALFRGMNFSPLYLRRLRKRAEESHKRRYPGDYVYNYVEGDGKTFDYGVDYLECAGCMFLERQNAFELARFLCPGDILYSEAFGWGLTRTMTLADGAEKCDFRFKKGGITRIAVPDALVAVVSRKG